MLEFVRRPANGSGQTGPDALIRSLSTRCRGYAPFDDNAASMRVMKTAYSRGDKLRTELSHDHDGLERSHIIADELHFTA